MTTTKKRDSKSRDGEATRRALIDSAAALFADDGIDGVSVRAINAAAGYGAAAAHYHFGSKDAILRAVLLDYGSDVLARIHDLASELDGRQEDPTVLEIVNVLAIPYQGFLESDYTKACRWLTICAQLSLANDDRLFSPMEDDDTAVVLDRLLGRAFPGADVTELHRNFALTANTLLAMAATWVGATDAEAATGVRGLDSLARFVAGGLVSLMDTAVVE